MARARAGLSQQQLSDRSGVPRVTIARWETGTREPTLASLRELVRACGLDLAIRLSEGDDSLEDLVADQRALAPAERLKRLLAADQANAALEALRWLTNAKAPTIVIGGVGATLLGAPQRPDDEAVAVVAGDPFALTAEMTSGGLVPTDDQQRWADSDRRWPWRLRGGGTVTIASGLPGARDYADLRRDAVTVDVDSSTRVRVAHPRDLLRLAEASANEGERARVPGLQALLSRLAEEAEES